MENKKASLANGNAVMQRDDMESPYQTNVLTSQDIDEVFSFLKQQMTTAGFSIQYGVARDGVYCLFRKGKMGKRDIKMLIEKYNITEWHYSLCWACDEWILANGLRVTATKIDLSPVQTMKEAYRYRNVF